MLFNNKSTFIKTSGEIDSLILAQWENLASDGMYLILTKTSDCAIEPAKVRPACSAVILSQLLFT